MAFVDRLRSVPFVFEVVPPHRRAGERVVAGLVQRVQDAVRSIPQLDAVNLPEVVEENYAARPLYRNLDPRAFARMLNQGLRVETIVDRVVSHLDGMAGLDAYVRESLEAHGMRNFVLVGIAREGVTYPGPDVARATARLRELTRGRRDVACGNIAIPERPGEVERLVRKTRAGVQFFTTQVLFEPEPVGSVLREYGEACVAAGLSPATVLLSFAPVADREDIEFLGWLGARITPKTAEALLDHRGREPGTASMDVARSTWVCVRDAAAGARHPVPLGVNVEEISVHNFDLAVRMARGFAALRDAGAT